MSCRRVGTSSQKAAFRCSSPDVPQGEPTVAGRSRPGERLPWSAGLVDAVVDPPGSGASRRSPVAARRRRLRCACHRDGRPWRRVPAAARRADAPRRRNAARRDIGSACQPWRDVMATLGVVTGPLGPAALAGRRGRAAWFAEYGDDWRFDVRGEEFVEVSGSARVPAAAHGCTGSPRTRSSPSATGTARRRTASESDAPEESRLSESNRRPSHYE